MTLKRYQPARKRKRPSKKNRPMKLALALGVVGVAAGSVYLAMHGEVLVGLLNGSVDFPDARFGRPANEQAVVAAKLAAEQGQAPAPAPKGPALKTTNPQALKPKASVAPSAAPSVAPSVAAVASPVTLAKVSPKPSAFPEDGQVAAAAAEDPTLAAAPLKPVKTFEVAAKAPVKPSVAPSAKPVARATVAPTAAPVAKASPAPVKVAIAAKPVVAKPTAQPSPTAKPASKVAAKPTARPSAAPAKVAGKPKSAPAAGPGASLYFDKNSSYLSGAEQQRLARLAASLKQKGGTIHVTGFADSVGDAKYNRWMAERRAARVAELLKSQSGGRVNVVIDAVGSVGAASGPDGEARNRRVEIQVR